MLGIKASYLNVRHIAVTYRHGTSVVVTDLINRIVQVLRRDLYWVKISAQDAELIKPVKPWDKG